MTQEACDVAKRLDAIVRNALSGDGATFAVWEKACLFGRSRSRRPVAHEAAGVSDEAGAAEESVSVSAPKGSGGTVPSLAALLLTMSKH